MHARRLISLASLATLGGAAVAQFPPAGGDAPNAQLRSRTHSQPAPRIELPATRPAGPETQTSPASAARKPAAIAPGVWIDWSTRTVIAAGHVVLRSGDLEFFACFEGKEHESIVRFDCAAAHLFVALGLIGLQPGAPPGWNAAERMPIPPRGDCVDVELSWGGPSPEDGAAGAAATSPAHRAHPFDWLIEAEYGRPPIPRPFLFTGSIILPDHTLSSDLSGAGMALVDQSDNLLSLSRDYSEANSDLWALANTAAIPPEGTPVRLLFRAAARRAHRFSLDFRGDARADGQFVSPADLADLLRINAQIAPGQAETIEVEGALKADVDRLKIRLGEQGVGDARVRFKTVR